ncbi:MAG: glycosyl hydrolase family 18 protein, partial [Anaerolineae bacterium]
MSEAKPASRFSSLLKSKRTERVVDLVIVPILLIASLLLPPASVGARLLDLDLPVISPDEPTEVVGPQGARLNVPTNAVPKRVRVRFDTIGAAELGAMEADSPEILAAQRVPAEVLAFEPFYRFDLKGDGPSASQLTLPIPYELAALDLADLYAWDGDSWQWIPSRVSDNGLDLIADLSEVHSLYLVAQTQAQMPRIGFVAPESQASSVPPSAAILSVQGATLAGDGSLANVPGRPNTAEGVSTLLRVTNVVDGVVRSDWLDNLLIDATLSEEHIGVLAGTADFDGIELDYRGADPALRAEFTAFVRALGEALHAQGKTLAVVLDPPAAASAYDTGAYDWRTIGEVADLVRVRAYATPNAYAVNGPMDDLLRWATDQIDRRKLDLALNAGCVITDDSGTERISYREAVTLLASELNTNDDDGLLLPGESLTVQLADLDSAKLTFDPEAQVYAFESTLADGTPQTVYLTNAATVARRLQYVTRYALGGASVAGALSPDADKTVATLLDDLPHTVVPPAPRFAYVYTVWSSDGDAIGSQVVPVDDASMTWTAPNNPGHYVIQAEISDDGGETVLESVASLDVEVPTPTFTPTPTNTPTPTPTNTPT